MGSDAVQKAVVWFDADRAGLVGDVIGRMGAIDVVAVGGPNRAAASELAETLGAPVADDFRKMLVDERPGSLLLASGTGIKRKDLRDAAAGGTHVIAVEPPDAELDTAGESNGRDPDAGVVVCAPWFRLAPAWQAAAEPEQVIGKVKALTVSCVGPAATGSLFARLYDALDLIGHMVGLPDEVAATMSGPLTETPDDLRAMTGHLTGHLRFRDGAAACITVSDRAFAFRRRAHAIGATGQLMLEDDRYRLFGEDGAIVDSVHPGMDSEPPPPAALIAAQWQRVLDRGHLPRPVNPAHIVALCHATLLSCRTGEIESTETMLRITTGG